jgi:hypothetical protein
MYCLVFSIRSVFWSHWLEHAVLNGISFLILMSTLPPWAFTALLPAAALPLLMILLNSQSPLLPYRPPLPLSLSKPSRLVCTPLNPSSGLAGRSSWPASTSKTPSRSSLTSKGRDTRSTAGCLKGPVGKPQEECMMSTSASFPSIWNQSLIDQ